MSLLIINPGFYSLVQDFGRFGMQKYGFTNGGPMDEHAFLWANKLLGNDFNCAQLEICMGGFVAKFQTDTVISVCGAQGKITLNNREIPPWRTHKVKTGDEIRIDGFFNGLYAYLAVKDGFQLEPQLGSRATVMREKLGGPDLNGQKLKQSTEIDYPSSMFNFSASTPSEFMPQIEEEIMLRYIPNSSETGCSEAVIDSFLQQTYEVSAEINRMGYRLKGEKIRTDGKGIISQGISVGTIQLPSDGQPIVLLKDRQTIGGYPQLGCVAYLDLAKLSQSKPGTLVRFYAVEANELAAELTAYFEFFDINYYS